MKTPSEISVNIVNNTSVTQRINLVSNPYDLQANLNNTTQYRWDITTYNFSTSNKISVQYKANGAASFSVYQTGISGSLTSAVAALNNLGIGFFYTYSASEVTYITTYNNQYTFGQLSIDVSTPPVYSPNALYVANQNFPTNQSFIQDLSGHGKNANTNLGTGINNSPILLDYPAYQPSGGYYGYVNMPYDGSNPATQLSFLLPNSYQFLGTLPYTFITWFQTIGVTVYGVPQTLFSALNTSGFDLSGYTINLNYNSGLNQYSLTHSRYDVITGVSSASVTLASFAPSTWLCAIGGYDGTNVYVGIYDSAGNYITDQNPSAATNTTTASPFWGRDSLPSESFFTGAFGYVAIYTAWAGFNTFQNTYFQYKNLMPPTSSPISSF